MMEQFGDFDEIRITKEAIVMRFATKEYPIYWKGKYGYYLTDFLRPKCYEVCCVCGTRLLDQDNYIYIKEYGQCICSEHFPEIYKDFLKVKKGTIQVFEDEWNFYEEES
jgi:hypothetical protein